MDTYYISTIFDSFNLKNLKLYSWQIIKPDVYFLTVVFYFYKKNFNIYKIKFIIESININVPILILF